MRKGEEVDAKGRGEKESGMEDRKSEDGSACRSDKSDAGEVNEIECENGREVEVVEEEKEVGIHRLRPRVEAPGGTLCTHLGYR
jgi:hypothetical protein